MQYARKSRSHVLLNTYAVRALSMLALHVQLGGCIISCSHLSFALHCIALHCIALHCMHVQSARLAMDFGASAAKDMLVAKNMDFGASAAKDMLVAKNSLCIKMQLCLLLS